VAEGPSTNYSIIVRQAGITGLVSIRTNASPGALVVEPKLLECERWAFT
jgi:hypothetical protein